MLRVIGVEDAQRQVAVDEQTLSQWLDEARCGSPSAVGRVLEACRPYLLMIANRELPAEVRQKVGASDAVQETFLEAQHDLPRFVGHSEEELLAWLRRILLNNVANLRRRYQETEKREVGREVSLESDESIRGLAECVPVSDPAPSSEVAREEERQLVQEAIGRLPEHLRQVLELRHRENLSFAEIGELIDRSPEAARKLWARAVEKLQEELRKR